METNTTVDGLRLKKMHMEPSSDGTYRAAECAVLVNGFMVRTHTPFEDYWCYRTEEFTAATCIVRHAETGDYWIVDVEDWEEDFNNMYDRAFIYDQGPYKTLIEAVQVYKIQLVTERLEA